MPVYRCIVANKSGDRREMIRSADTEFDAGSAFSTGDWFLVSIYEIDSRGTGKRGRSIPAGTIREFTEMTSLLLESGLTLREALEIELDFPADPRFISLVEGLLDDIRKGASFAAAIEGPGVSFPPLYRGMIRIGDRIGSVESVFPRLSRYLADRKALRDKLVGASAYPLMVLIFAVLGTMVISFVLLPRVADLFSQLGGAVAEDIRSRMDYAFALFRGFAVFLILGTGAAAFLAVRRRGEGRFPIMIDRAILHLPLIGTFVRSSEILNFALAMEILSTSKISLEISLTEAAAVVGNNAFRKEILSLRESVVKGNSLSRACSESRELPPYIARWVAVGEHTGTPERVFAQIRRYFQSDVERFTSRITALIEPVLIILVGLIVLFLILTFVMPLFSLYETLI